MITEIEQYLIGACLLAGSTEDAPLQPADFYDGRHALIWSAMLDMGAEPIDSVTVADKVGKAHLAPYISELMMQATSTQNIAAYAKRVQDYAIQRRLVRACSQIISMSQGEGSASEKVAKAQSMLEAVETKADDSDEYKSFVAYLESEPTDLKAGFFDSHTGGIEAGLWVIAAGTGVGKTTLAMNLAANLLRAAPVTYYSYEMGTSQVMGKMICAKGSIPHDNMRDRKLSGGEWENTLQAITTLKSQGFRVVDRNHDIDSLCAHIRQSVRKRGIRAAFVDYLQLVPSTGDSRVLEVANISRKLKLTSLDLGIPIFALSQLSRKHEERSNPRPRNSDLRESGSIEQDADVVLFLYDEAKLLPDSSRKGITELFAGKNRNGELFSVMLTQELGMCRFSPYTGTYAPEAAARKPNFRD